MPGRNGTSDFNGVKDVQNNITYLNHEEKTENHELDLNSMVEIHCNNLELEESEFLPKVCFSFYND